MTSDLGIEPGPHWWEASALTTAPSLHPVSDEKSRLHPMQMGEWLGFVIYAIGMTFQIPGKKVAEIKRFLYAVHVIEKESVSYRDLARVTGSIIAVAIAAGPVRVFLPDKCNFQVPVGLTP